MSSIIIPQATIAPGAARMASGLRGILPHANQRHAPPITRNGGESSNDREQARLYRAKAVVLASRLRSHGLFVEPPKTEDISNGNVGCPDRQTQFMTFMQALASELPAGAEQEPESRQGIGVRLTPADEPIRMESYSADRSAYPSAGVTLSFTSPYDRAAEFWKIIATQVQPHLDRMRVLDEGFVRMTGFQYAVFDRSGASHAEVLANLEQAARTVNERIATIPQERLAEIRSTGPYGFVQILLRVDGFGPGDDAMHPLTAADRTFLDIVEKNRRAAARGEISTRE